MSRWIELPVFAGIAVLVHVALFTQIPEEGSAAGGSGGDAVISLAGAAPTVQAMVARWEQPREVPPIEMDSPDIPDPVSTAAPELPQIDLAPAARAQVQISMSEPEQSAPPEIDTQSAPPPPEPEPEPTPEPEPAPEPTPEPEPAPEQAEVARTTSAGRQEQRAAGSGGSSQAGNSGQAATSTAATGNQARLEAVWGAQIRSRIERRKRYPSGVRGAGDVVVQITVARSGDLVGARVARSSGVAAFDEAALRAVTSARRFPKAPQELSAPQLSFALKISFSR